MSGIFKLTRKELAEINPDPRWIRTMERLFSLIPSETDSLSGVVEEIRYEAGIALAAAQQAIGMVLEKNVFGSFLSTIDQAGTAPNTAKAATFNTTVASNGISLSGSQMTVDKKGTYKIEFRIQL